MSKITLKTDHNDRTMLSAWWKDVDENFEQVQSAVNAVGTENLVSGAVSADQLAAGSVTTEKLADKAVTRAKLADGAVGTDQLEAGAVTTEKIAAQAVTAAKIADSAVGTAHIANANVTTSKIADKAVSTNKIATAAVTSDKIMDDAVTKTHIADGAVTIEKIADSADVVTGTRVASATQTGVIKLYASGSGVNRSGLSVSEDGTCYVTTKNGLYRDGAGGINIDAASEAEIDAGTDAYKPIVPATLDYAVQAVTGQMSELETDDKTSIVAAVNELNSKVSVMDGGALEAIDLLNNICAIHTADTSVSASTLTVTICLDNDKSTDAVYLFKLTSADMADLSSDGGFDGVAWEPNGDSIALVNTDGSGTRITQEGYYAVQFTGFTTSDKVMLLKRWELVTDSIVKELIPDDSSLTALNNKVTALTARVAALEANAATV